MMFIMISALLHVCVCVSWRVGRRSPCHCPPADLWLVVDGQHDLGDACGLQRLRGRTCKAFAATAAAGTRAFGGGQQQKRRPCQPHMPGAGDDLPGPREAHTSIWWMIMGLLQNSTSGLGQLSVRGRSRVP